jgi:hypothetical protein
MGSLISSIAMVKRSTGAVVLSFTDENGAGVTPTSDITWTLTDPAGNVYATGAAPATGSVITVVLSGDDLDLPENKDSIRVFTACTTYSSSLGDNLPIRNSLLFVLKNAGSCVAIT